MSLPPQINPPDEERLIHAIVVLNAKVLGLILGLIFGLIIFLATNWLILKGGAVVGPHLELLGHFFIGYRVSFVGSIIGFFWGFVVGFWCGTAIGWIYNRLVELRN
jgi:hypothetical protein